MPTSQRNARNSSVAANLLRQKVRPLRANSASHGSGFVHCFPSDLTARGRGFGSGRVLFSMTDGHAGNQAANPRSVNAGCRSALSRHPVAIRCTAINAGETVTHLTGLPSVSGTWVSLGLRELQPKNASNDHAAHPVFSFGDLTVARAGSPFLRAPVAVCAGASSSRVTSGAAAQQSGQSALRRSGFESPVIHHKGWCVLAFPRRVAQRVELSIANRLVQVRALPCQPHSAVGVRHRLHPTPAVVGISAAGGFPTTGDGTHPRGNAPRQPKDRAAVATSFGDMQ